MTEEFVLPISREKFNATNGLWNQLMLNDPWSVGYVTSLISLMPWQHKEEWEAYYYAKGEERNARIAALPPEMQDILQDEQRIRTDRAGTDRLGYEFKNLNTQYGRTREQLYKKAGILLDNMRYQQGLTVDDCFECVRFRVICETWNGIVLRERKTIENLQQLMPGAVFRNVPGEMDYRYAVDYEVYKEGRLVYALQVKPESYTWNAPYIESARIANSRKNAAYETAFGVPVHTIIATAQGVVKNLEILEKL